MVGGGGIEEVTLEWYDNVFKKGPVHLCSLRRKKDVESRGIKLER